MSNNKESLAHTSWNCKFHIVSSIEGEKYLEHYDVISVEY